MIEKRLSQTEAVAVFTLHNGHQVNAATASRLVKRGFASYHNGKLVLTAEGRAAFHRWAGAPL
jgi:hypothetical protein